MANELNGYVCFYRDKRIEVYAESSYAAQIKAADQLKVKGMRRSSISVVLAEKAGVAVEFDPASL